jgi:hypothetical protein
MWITVIYIWVTLLVLGFAVVILLSILATLFENIKFPQVPVNCRGNCGRRRESSQASEKIMFPSRKITGIES